jgi:hypothetical protein
LVPGRRYLRKLPENHRPEVDTRTLRVYRIAEGNKTLGDHMTPEDRHAFIHTLPLADFAERRAHIEAQVNAAATEMSCLGDTSI